VSAAWPYIAAIVPTILVATLFYFLIKGMIEGDRRERLAQSRFEAEEDRQRATAAGEAVPPAAPAPPGPAVPGASPASGDSDAGNRASRERDDGISPRES
jgi:hypothetical protein